MNLFSINNAAINSGGSSRVVAALATLVISGAVISVTGGHVLAASVNVSHTIVINAAAQKHHRANVNLLGSVQVQVIGTQTHALEADITGTTTITAFYPNEVSGSVNITGAATTLVTAGKLADSDFVCTAEVSPEATQIQFGNTIAIAGTAAIVNTIEATITRFVTANIVGSAGITVDYNILSGGVTTHYSGAFVTCTATIPSVASIFSVDANVISTAEIIVTPHVTQHGNAVLLANSALGIADGQLNLVSTTTFLGTAEIVAQGTRNLKPLAIVGVNTCNILAKAKQQHAGIVTLLSKSLIQAVPEHSLAAKANITHRLFVIPTATKIVSGIITLATTATCVVDDDKLVVVSRLVTGNVNLVAQSTVIVNATNNMFGNTNIVGTGTVYAATITNPEAIDPPGRTFIRPLTVTEFIRPAEGTQFRRVA